MSTTQQLLIVHRGGTQVLGAIRGTEACVLALLRNIDRTKFNPLVLCNNETHLAAFRDAGTEGLLFDNPTVMLNNGNLRLPLFRYLRALHTLNNIVTARKISAIYCSGGAPCQVAVPIAKLRKIPTICHFHHPASRRYHYFWLTKFTDQVIFPSRYTREQSLAAVDLDGIVIPNGINCRSEYIPAPARDSTWRSEHAIGRSDVVVGQVGAFSPNKRHDVLISAFRIARRRMANLKLVLVGDGPERKRMEQLTVDHGLQENVVFAGYVPRVAELFQHTIDINVLASDEEGLGLVLLEGGACGVPSIGSDCSGIREAIRDGETGYLFRPGDVDELAQRIIELAMDPERRDSMGRAARHYVETNFSEERYAANVSAQIEALIASSRAV